MSYPGGKAGPGVAQRIINHMPPHEVYIEPFLGAGAVLRTKRPALENIGIEIDSQVIAERHQDGAIADTASNGDTGLRTTIYHADGLQYLRNRRWQGNELVYCDPPYLRESRTGGRLYRHEFTDEQHRQLLNIVNELKRAGVMVMVSGYYSKLYAQALKHWNLGTFGSMTRRGMALEHLWTSFPEPLELHDYRFLGDDYRERERIKKKIRRWTARLEDMPKLERQALLGAIAQIDGAAEPRMQGGAGE